MAAFASKAHSISNGGVALLLSHFMGFMTRAHMLERAMAARPAFAYQQSKLCTRQVVGLLEVA